MKDLYSIFIVVCLAMVLFGGANIVSQEAILKQNLDEESLNLIGKYDPMVIKLQENITKQQTNIKTGIEVEPDSNTLSDFYRTFAEGKSRIQTFKDGIKLIYKLPDILLLSIPFIEEEDLSIYKIIITLMAAIIVFIVGFKAIFQQNVGGNK